MTWRLLGIAALIAVLAFWALYARPSRNDAPASAAAAGTPPGYQASGATLVETGPDGRALYTLRAAQIRQDPRTQVVDLDDVTMDYRDSRGDLWLLRSRRGKLIEPQDRVEFEGAVRVTGNLNAVAGAARIATERLAFDTRTEIVSTRVPVTLTWSGHRLDARGMSADLKDQRLKLESAVQGRFAP
jgi:LPS export ABC transporter protein LptC